MALYGLSVFLETSESLRKGRKRYIAASFTITILSCLTASLDVAHHFQIIFEATSPQHWAELMEANVKNWKPLLSDTALGIVIWIGDALLVGFYPYVGLPFDLRFILHRYIAAM